jgi:hypothetical protein
MTLAIWVVPLALSVLVIAIVSVASIGGRSESSNNGWSLAPDGLRIVGVAVLAMGSLAAIWIGVGDHQLRSVLGGRAPFDWSAACTIGAVSALLGGSLLLTDWSRRRSWPKECSLRTGVSPTPRTAGYRQP